MPYCRNCGKMMEENDKFCKSCGTKRNIDNNINVPNVQKNINNTNKKKNTQKGKITNIPQGIILIIILIIFGVILSNVINSVEPVINVLAEVLTEEQLEEANDIIKKCELEGGEITRDELLDTGYGEGSLGYRIKKDNIDTVMYVKEGKILCIKYADKYLYKEGSYLDKLSDYIITSNERTQIITYCENIIKSILKSPSTAKFPWDYNEWPMKKEKGVVTVQSYVDAQNSFGATTRSQFQFIIENGNTKSLIFDGKEYIK